MKTVSRRRFGSPVPVALDAVGEIARLPYASVDAKYSCPVCGQAVVLDPSERFGRFVHERPGPCPLDSWQGALGFAVHRLKTHLDAVLKGEANFPWLTATCECGLPAFRDLRGTFNRVDMDPDRSWGVGFDLHSDAEPIGRRVTVFILGDEEALEQLQGASLKRWIGLRPRDVLSSPSCWALESTASGSNYDGVKVPRCPLCSGEEE